MPEGPSLVILREKIEEFAGRTVLEASGLREIDYDRITGHKLLDVRTWGKHLLLCFSGFTVRVHLMMFGSYRINERKATNPALRLTFANSELNFYSCNIKILDGDADSIYDWSADVMNDAWDAKAAKAKLKQMPEAMVCDALLDQNIFSGVGNIIKSEALYRAKVHPESLVGKIPTARLSKLIEEARDYTLQFLRDKKKGVLAKNWEAYTKKICKRCDLPIIKDYTGKGKRRSFFCTNCQKLYT